jgi:light-regulated signal transduction histidine kinase (bacteriophytochrome)
MVTFTEANATISYGTLPVIEGYPTEMKLLFQNLLVNAVKFRKKNIAPFIQINVEKEKDFWKFAIIDNGIGIEKVYIQRIFDIFQRLNIRAEYQGSGIGLAHCKKIVELHGGKSGWNQHLEVEVYFCLQYPKKQ